MSKQKKDENMEQEKNKKDGKNDGRKDRTVWTGNSGA